MRRLIDTHSHIFLEEFAADLDEVVSRAMEAGVSDFILPSINLQTLADLLRVRNAYPGHCHAAIGLHPTELNDDWREELDRMKDLLDLDRRSGDNVFVGIGEVGLDLYWEQDDLKRQTDVFRCQIEWALEYDLPLMIHSRSAFSKLCEILDCYNGRGLRGVFHCFSDGVSEAGRLLGYEGFMFGIGGVSTFRKSSVPDALRMIPHDRVIVETDCPYLAPVPMRGHRNEPSFMVRTVEKIAEVWNCLPEEVADVTTANACSLFAIQ